MQCGVIRRILHFAIPPQSDRQPWNAEPEGLAPAPREKASAPLFNRARVLYSALHYRKNRRGARRVVSTAPSACGWLRGTSRTSPGPPRRWQRPVWLRSTSARGRGFAAYLSACGGQPFNVRCAHYARGASLSTFGFVTIVPRYLPKASNSLTFVRGADRACCAPHKWSWRPTNARMYQPPHAPEGALAGAPGCSTLPHARAYCVPRKWLWKTTFALHVPTAARPRRV